MPKKAENAGPKLRIDLISEGGTSRLPPEHRSYRHVCMTFAVGRVKCQYTASLAYTMFLILVQGLNAAEYVSCYRSAYLHSRDRTACRLDIPHRTDFYVSRHANA